MVDNVYVENYCWYLIVNVVIFLMCMLYVSDSITIGVMLKITALVMLYVLDKVNISVCW